MLVVFNVEDILKTNKLKIHIQQTFPPINCRKQELFWVRLSFHAVYPEIFKLHNLYLCVTLPDVVF